MSEKNSSKIYEIIQAIPFVLLLFAQVAIYSMLLDIPTILSAPISIVVSIIIYIVFIYIKSCIKSKIKKSKETKENKIKEREEASIDFYRTCKGLGISFPLSANERFKLKSIAEKYGFPTSNCQQTFNLGYNKTLENQQLEEEKIKSLIKAKLEYTGNSKYIQGLVNTFEKDYDKYLTFYEKAESILERKTNVTAHKQDWAIAGGIAEGIGGFGIGILTALKVQEENEKAELRAQATRSAAYEAISKAKVGNTSLKMSVNKVTNALKDFETKLNENTKVTITPDYYNVRNYFIRESGTICISILPNQKNFVGQKKLDGIAYVKVINNNNIVGEGYISCPGYLINFDYQKNLPGINAIGLNFSEPKDIICFPINGHTFSPDEEYQFEFYSFNTLEIDVEQLKIYYKRLCDVYNEDYIWIKNNLMRNLFVDATCT